MPKIAHIATALAMLASPALADCYDEAAARQYVHPDLLRAIAEIESDRVQTISKPNTDGSVDYCLMQINSKNLPALAKFGITQERLMENECTCIHSGAWILSKFISRYGNTWGAVAAYNAGRPIKNSDYAQRVYRRFLSLTGAQAAATADATPTFMEDNQ